MSDNCPVCEKALRKDISSASIPGEFVAYTYDCPCCGKFMLTFSHIAYNGRGGARGFMEEQNNSRNSDWRPVLSHNIRKMQRNDQPVDLSSDLLKAILKKPLPSRDEQVNNLIIWFAENTSPGKECFVQPSTHQSIVGAKDQDGFIFILKYLLARGLLDPRPTSELRSYGEGFATLTFDGWQYYDQLKRGAIGSRKAFMAMKYGDPELNKIVEDHFKPAVADTGFELCRLDEEPKAGLIDDRLRVEIRNSRFLISDLTYGNNGAYWEAGYAEGLGKPVIYTCKKEEFDKHESHFDTNHHLTVTWDENEIHKAVESLKATIRATLPDEAKLSDD